MKKYTIFTLAVVVAALLAYVVVKGYFLTTDVTPAAAPTQTKDEPKQEMAPSANPVQQPPAVNGPKERSWRSTTDHALAEARQNIGGYESAISTVPAASTGDQQ